MEKIPLLMLTAVSCVVTLAAQRDIIRPLEQLALPERLANAATAYVVYLGKMFYPACLAVLYPLRRDSPPAWQAVAAVTVLLAISTAAFVVRRKHPFVLFGWLWYLGTLAPVIGIVQVGNQALADRYTYLPQIGLTIAIVWSAAQVAGAWPDRRRAAAATAGLIVAGLMVCAWQQTKYWRDSEALWSHALLCTSQNSIAHNNFGAALVSRGNVDDAIAHYREAVQINPEYAEAHNNLGAALAGRGQVDEAIAHYRRTLEIKPDFAKSHFNFGIALAGRGQIDEAIAHYQKALEIRPDYEKAHNNLGAALAGRGRIDEAIAHFREAIEINPDYAEAYYNLGLRLADRGRVDEALDHYQKALDLAVAQNNRALAETIRAKMKK
jgi:tetratricopeptide (TPR) repeat protein